MNSFFAIYLIAGYLGLSAKDRIGKFSFVAVLIGLVFLYYSIMPVGRDFLTYSQLFEGQDPVKVDFGFKLFADFLSYLDILGEGRTGLIVSSLLILAGHFYFFSRMSQNGMLLAAIFLLLPPLYFAGLNLVRQHLAIALALAALCQFEAGRRKASLALSIVGIATHQSVLLLLLFAAFSYLKNRHFQFLILAIAIISLLLAVLGPLNIMNLFTDRYLYFSYHESINSAWAAVGLAFGLFAAGLLSYQKVSKSYKIKLGFLFSYLYLISITLWLVTDTSNFFLRISALFLPVAILVLGENVIVNSKLATSYRIAILIVLSVVFWMEVISDPSLGAIT